MPALAHIGGAERRSPGASKEHQPPLTPTHRFTRHLGHLATTLLAVACAGPFVAALSAQADAPPQDTVATDTAEAVSTASPRASLDRFFEFTRSSQYADAARFLDLADSLRPRGPELARQLKAILDRHLWVDVSLVSPSAMGDTTDGLPAGVDQIGFIPGPGGVREPVRLTRAVISGETLWRFSRATVNRIPAWYAALGNRWMLENLPPALLRPGPLELLWWQWLALPVLIAAAVVIGYVLGRLLRFVFGRIVRRTQSDWDDAIARRLGPPVTAGLACAAAGVLLPFLGLYEPATDAMVRALKTAFLIVFFWAVWRTVDVVSDVALRSHWAHGSAASRSLIPLGERIGKVVILAMAAVASLSLLGYPVASLIAGLGLGGLALALAAQKTVENLFGAFSLGVDQPFRVGDFVKIEDFVGTVELIGLRSTRFRTLDRTLITIPNGRLAEMRLESFSVRDRMRLATIISLVYETSAPQMREVLAGFERVLRAHPKIWPDAVVVRFSAFSDSSLDIEIMAWFQTPEWGEFQLIRQEILLQLMDVVEQAGTAFAFPTRTVHLASSAPSPILPHQ